MPEQPPSHLSAEEHAELARLEAAFDIAGGRGVELADRIDALRARRDRETPAGVRVVDVLDDVCAALDLLDDNGDIDALRDYDLIDEDLYAAAVHALRALRDAIIADSPDT